MFLGAGIIVPVIVL